MPNDGSLTTGMKTHPPKGSVLRPRGVSVGVWLLALILVVLLPVLAFTEIVLQRNAAAERDGQIGQVQQRAESLANTIERFVASTRILVQVMAKSNDLQAGQLTDFHAYARKLIDETGLGTAVILIDKDGQTLLNSRQPTGIPLPKTSFVNYLDSVRASKTPVVTDMRLGATSGEFRLGIMTPVTQSRENDWVLAITAAPALLEALIHTEGLPAGWVGAVIDGSGTIIARNTKSAEFVGKQATLELLAARKTAKSGPIPGRTIDGIPIVGHFVNLPGTGWTVAIGVPSNLFDEPLNASRRFLMQLGAAILALAGLTALLGGWYMNRQIRGLVHAAEELGAGRTPVAHLSHVRELNRLVAAFDAAYVRSHKREVALRDSESEFRAFFDNAVVGVVQLDRMGRFAKVNQRYCELTGYSPEELLAGMSSVELCHPDEADVERLRIERYVNEIDETLASQKRYRRKTGEWIWVRVTSKSVRDEQTGKRLSCVALVEDITEEKKKTEQKEFLLNEVNHRAKNVLAVVQAVARQTSAQDNPAQFTTLFNQRLSGLAASHDLLVRSEWQGVCIKALLSAQLGHFEDLIGTRILFTGPLIQIRPSAAQTLGMAINELATNAGKYGALSNASGKINIDWTIVELEAGGQFRLTWSELGGPEPAPPTRQGFGHTVLVDMVMHNLEADVSLSYPKTGLVWRVEAPVDRIC